MRRRATALVTAVVVWMVNIIFEVESRMIVPVDGIYPIVYHGFLELTLPSKYQCMELCVALALCRSISYRERTGRCFINSDDESRQSDLMSGYNDIVLQRAGIPQEITAGSCQLNSCDADEMCVNGVKNFTCLRHGKFTVKCPENSARRGNKCYKLFEEKRTWNGAKEFCSTRGSMLTEIHSFDVDSFLLVLITFLMENMQLNGEGVFWTGLQYSSSQRAWVWNGTGESLTSHHRFMPSIPTYADGMCMGIPYVNRTVIFKWTSVNCNDMNIFVCQYESPDFWL